MSQTSHTFRCCVVFMVIPLLVTCHVAKSPPHVLATALAKEYDALYDLYKTCNGSSWRLPTTTHRRNHTSWGSQEVCSWYGVRCNAQGHVVLIDLEQPGMMTGCELPTSLSVLTEIVTFDIAGGLTGTIPSFIRGWSKLQHLKFYENNLSGTLPEWLPELKDLVELAVVPSRWIPRGKRRGLTGTIPSSYRSLAERSLKIIVLDDNSLEGTIPDWVFKVPFYRFRGNEKLNTSNTKHFRFYQHEYQQQHQRPTSSQQNNHHPLALHSTHGRQLNEYPEGGTGYLLPLEDPPSLLQLIQDPSDAKVLLITVGFFTFVVILHRKYNLRKGE
eukprot:PhF_6_TR30139/c3_g1_i2/m.44093